MTILSNIISRIEYFNGFRDYQSFPIGSHNSQTEIRGNLGYLMKQLKESQHNTEIVDELLEKIHKEMKLDYELESFKEEYKIYLRLLVDRQELINTSSSCFGFFKLKGIRSLNKENWNMWGSYKQFLFGTYVVDALNKNYNYKLHPIWGCLLNPTGGIIGGGNNTILRSQWNSGISLHACAHDAGGYLYRYHKLGPGFNYLNTWLTVFPKWSQYSCQLYGISWWK